MELPTSSVLQILMHALEAVKDQPIVKRAQRTKLPTVIEEVEEPSEEDSDHLLQEIILNAEIIKNKMTWRYLKAEKEYRFGKGSFKTIKACAEYIRKTYGSSWNAMAVSK